MMEMNKGHQRSEQAGAVNVQYRRVQSVHLPPIPFLPDPLPVEAFECFSLFPLQLAIAQCLPAGVDLLVKSCQALMSVLKGIRKLLDDLREGVEEDEKDRRSFLAIVPTQRTALCCVVEEARKDATAACR